MAAIGTPGIGSPDFDAKAEFRDKVWRLITLIPACHFTTTEHIANAVNCETIIVNDLLSKYPM